MHHYNVKDRWKFDLGGRLAIHLKLETRREITIKLCCYTLVVNPMMTIHSLTSCAHAKPTGKLGLTYARKNRYHIDGRMGVINLCRKTLSKLIHCFLDILIKVLSFSVNMFYVLKIQSIHVPRIFKMKSDYTIILWLDKTLCVTGKW